MSSRISASLLHEASRQLLVDWERTRTSWTDAKSLEFQKAYLDALPPLILQAGLAVDEMNNLLTRIRNDCE